MKKIILSIILTSLLLPSSAITVNAEIHITSSTIYVDDDGPADYNNIQNAIDNASDGDTVFVYDGYYQEKIVIDKSINLIGEDKDITIINANRSGNAVVINANGVSVSGFSIVCSSYTSYKDGNGIYITSNNNNIFDNIIENNLIGIGLSESSHHNTVNNNKIKYNYYQGIDIASSVGYNTIVSNQICSNDNYGIHISVSPHNNIIDNKIEDHEIGLRMHYNLENKITNNRFVGGGLEIEGGSLSEWDSHTIEDNSVNGKHLRYYNGMNNLIVPINAGQIIIVNSSNITIQNQLFSNLNTAIQIAFSSDIKIKENTILDTYAIGIYIFNTDYVKLLENSINNAKDYAIYMLYCNNSIISNNEISNSPNYYHVEALLIARSSDCVISNNGFLNCYTGIRLSGSINSKIYDNSVIESKSRGIELSRSTRNEVKNNEIRNCMFGINLGWDSSENEVFGNTITGNEKGIFLGYARANKNIISKNIIKGNDYGIYSIGSDQNNIKINIIEENKQGIFLNDSNRNKIIFNDFRYNIEDASFEKSNYNKWKRNYWNQTRILPKIIYGTSFFCYREINWINLDWRPAKQPYDL